MFSGAQWALVIGLFSIEPLLGGCIAPNPDHSESEVIAAVRDPGSDQPIQPLPDEPEANLRLVGLGEALFYSPILSEDGKVSCGSCHKLSNGLADASAHSAPEGRNPTPTNSTTMFNIRYLFRLTWTGKFDSLESHLDALIQNPKLMGSNWQSLSTRLEADRGWREQFNATFSDGVTQANARTALLAYERSLTTPGCAFDRWLNGDDSALTKDAREGYALFVDYGCVSCHQGMTVGGNMLERFGVARDYFKEYPAKEEAALGRYNVTEREEDRHVFRVPSLRNVALTAPYFHDGSAATLEDAVFTMGLYQLGWEIPDKDVKQIVAFLRSLTGKYRGRPL